MFKFNHYFKIVCSVIFLLSLLVISSCGGDQKKVSELDFEPNCKGVVCILRVVDKDFLRTRNILGQTQYTLLKTTPLKSNDPKDDGTHLLWSSKDGTLATQEELTNAHLGTCPDGKCTVTSNPTGFEADHLGISKGHVKGYVTNPDGKKEYIDKDVSVNITAAKPTVTATASQDNPLSYAVNADLTNTGITDAWSYAWSSSPAASFKDATAASTEVEFANGGVYTISFTATPPEGSSDKAQTGTTTVTTGQSGASITYKHKGLLYSFTANTTNTGLPSEGVTYAWSVNGNFISTGSSVTYLFANANTQYTVSLETKIGDKVIGTDSVAVTTGDVINPTLTVTQDGANPLAYTVTADESATNIGSDWSRVWSIDGKAVEGASTAKLSYTFGLTDHKYTVSYVASKEGYPDRTASIDVTTKGATKPTVTATASQDNPLSYAVNADLTNTGITDAWSYAWSSTPDGTFKDATAASTEVEFANGGVGYTITFTATPPEGSTDVAQTGTTTVTTGQSGASITYKHKGLLYSFTANTTNTGLPSEGVVYNWSVNDNPIGTGSSVTYLFANANTQYTVSLETKIGDKVIGTDSVAVTTGDVINPTLTVTQDGANPLAYTVTADESATNIGSDWSRVWSIDGKAVEGASTAKLSYTFGLTDHKYTVSYVASKEGYPDRTASIDVTTKGATKPTVTATASQDNPLSYAVNADLTNTGITDAWSYAWSSTPDGTFKDATAASTEVEFANGGVGYTITFTATPPEGSTDVAQTGTTTVTTGQSGASITYKHKGLLYSFTANTTNTGLPSEGVVYNWSVNDNPIGTGSSVTYLFANANTQYTVSLETKIGDKVIGTDSVAVTTGDVINPTLTVTQDGANPLAYTVTADESATNIGSDWSRVWSIDGKAVEGASTAKLSYTFGLTAHKYTVSYVASKEGYPDRTASIDVTTKGATKPTVTATASQDNPLSYAVNADLTNTGITDAWSYAWSSTPDGTFKDATAASTEVEFANGGVTYTITFTATPPEGSTDVAQTGTTTVTTGQSGASITYKHKGLLYSFTANTTNTGLPSEGVVYNWSVNGKVIGSGSNIAYLFTKANTQYSVSLETKIADKVIGTNSVTVKTGNLINPTLTVTQDGANPLAYTVTADESATNIGSDWSRVWSIDGEAVEGVSTAKLSYTFGLTDHKYTVSYVASKEGYPDRTASIDVTTKGATKPTVTATVSQDNPLSYAVNADLTNTGITDAWNYQWSSTPEATFKDATLASTEVEFANGGVGYTITFTATPPEGSTDVAQTGTTTVTIGQLAAKITSKQEKGLLYSFTANTTNTGLPSEGVVYNWSVNGKVIGSGSNIAYLFTKANTQYSVSLETKIADKVIGTNSVTVKTGNLINPTLTVTQDGANPLAYTVTADESATNIGSDWSRVWSIDGEAVEGVSTAKLSYTFGLTDHKYTVSYVASKEGYPDRTASIDVTTKGATKPTVTATVSQDNPLSYAVNADLTNTGITDAWNYQWSSTPEATFKDATLASTEVEFANGGVGYTITFTATPPEGSTDVAQTGTTTVTIGQLAAKITSKQEKGLLYSFTANTTNTGLPSEGVVYNWSVNGKVIGSGSNIAYLFTKANTQYSVSLETKIADKVIGTNSVTVKTGNLINPTLTVTQDGANPLAYTVTADESATNIGSDWSRVWSIDGEAVEGASTAKLSYTFGLTDHKYTVSYVASKEGYPDRTASIDVTTKGATKPTVTATVSQDNPLSYAVNADLTNTGITDAWNYQWSSTPEATFKDATLASTEVEFANGGVGYTITFTATPPEGSTDVAQTGTTTVTIGQLAAKITSKQEKGLLYSFTANTTNTGLPSEGVVYNWSVNGKVIGSGSNIAYLFTKANTQYSVSLETKIADKVIGTNSVTVKTGNLINPTLTVTQDGANPLAYTVTADESATNIGSDWSRVWSIDGEAVEGASTAKLSYTFGLTDHKYTVSYVASKEGYPDRTASIDVTTKGATKPTVTATVSQDNPLSYAVNADLTNTGITDAWNYQWSSTPEATFKDATLASTEVEFANGGVGYTITFTATPPEGSTDVAQTGTTTVTIGQLAAKITSKQEKGLLYSFTANTTNTGLPSEGVVYNWSVNGKVIGSGSNIAYLFTKANTQYSVSLETKIADKVIGTNSVTVKTGNLINPTLTVTQDGANPLAYTVTADESATNIGSDWSRVWSIDGEAVEGASTAKLSYTFGLTDHKYTVSYVASKEGYPDRTASIDVTTKGATKPTITLTATSDSSYYVAKADLTNTGITAAWSYAWSSSPAASFKDATAASTDVEFASGGVGYTITFTATPPEGSSDKVQTATTTVTTGALAAQIRYKQIRGLLYSFSGDTTNTDLPKDGVMYAWSVNDNPVGRGSTPSIDILFAKDNTKYTVSLETKIGDKVIGTDSVTITIGDVINPTLIATQFGENPLSYMVTASTAGTIIGSGSTYKWSGGDGVTFTTATGTIAVDRRVSTGVDFALTAHKYTVVFTATSPQGAVRTSSVDVTTGAATAPKLSSSAGSSALNFNVKADLTYTGITDAWSYAWSSTPEASFKDATAASTDVEFANGGVTYTISFTATPPEGSSDKAQTATTTVTTGDVINPTLSAKQAGADPLAYTVTAATTGTNIGSGWTYKWSGGDGVTFTTATGTISSAGDSVSTGVDFALTAHKYTVVFTATSPQGAVRTSSVDVTTKAATKPTITLAASPDSSYYLVKADLTNTGITDAWGFGWRSTPTATFVYPLAATTTGVYFSVPPGTRKSYDLTFIASPPEGSSDKTQRVTRTVTIDDSHVINLTLTATQDGANPLAYTITADESATNIGADWSRVWSIDGKVVDGASTDRLHYTFGLTDHKYTVRYVASKEGYIGRTESIDVTTKAATKPTITLTATSDSSYYVAKADLTNTGITAAWNYGWKSTPTATFVHPLAATTGVYFSVPPGTRKSYDLTFTATPPEGSSDKSQRVTRTFTIADSHVINPTLTATQDGANPLAYTVTADESATKIGADWSRVWSIDGKVVDGASTAKLSYTFGLTDHKYTVSYVASKEGYTDRTASIDVTTKAATKPTVTATASQDNPLSYAVNADLTNTGITDAWSYAWSSTPEGTFKDATVASTEVEFANGGVTYTISFTATPPEGSSDKAQIVTTTVTTDDVINPTLSAKQDGANPLAYTITADESATKIGADWSRVWSIDGKVVDGASTAKLDHTFDLTDHKYTVSYVASKEGYPDRTASIDVTTKAATKPTVTATPSQDNPLSYAVKADLTNTGITDAWSYRWTSKPSATFADSTKATTSVDLPSYGTSYDLTFTATPPEGSSDKAQTGTTKVTIGQLGLSISVKKVKGLLYDFTINTTNTLPKEASYIWRLNNPTNRPPTTSFTSTVQGRPYLFPRANMKFTVILEVELGDKVIGTDSVTVTTGDVINPTFTATQDGANPLVYTLTADESGTNIKWIPTTVTRKWFVDGNLVAQNTKTLHYTFGLTNHTYHIKYNATAPWNDTRKVKPDITTKAATKPTVTATASQDNPLSYVVKADLTNTGITDAWSYQWSSTPEGTFKDATAATTDVEFGKGGVHTISFTATPPEGSSDKAQTGTTTVTAGQLGASIRVKQEKGLLYTFTANTTNTGLPSEGVTYAWSINGNSIGSGSSITYLFPNANKRYTVSLETKIGTKVIGTDSVTVKVGGSIDPAIIATRDGVNPLVYTIMADESATNIGADWSRQWYIDGKVVAVNTKTLHYTFDLTYHTYTVKYVASKAGYDSREVTEDVHTKAANVPTATATPSQDNPLSYTVSAHLTNTGITAAWRYHWRSIPSATFADPTKATTSVDFPSFGKSYELIFLATPPESTQFLKRAIIKVTLGKSISVKQEKGLLYSFTANTTNTGLPSEGVVYNWSVNNNPIGTGSNIDYFFPKANTQYTVSLETKIGDKVIGTDSVTVTTGDIVNPALSVTQDGENPLVYTITADESATNIGADWSRVWSIDGKVVDGASTDRLHYTFGLTHHLYTVKYVASHAGYDSREATKGVTTALANNPTLTATESQDNPLSYTVNADLTNTGITAAWSYQWSSTPSAKFADSTKATTSVDLPSYTTSYKLTFTAIPPNESTSRARRGTTTITPGHTVS